VEPSVPPPVACGPVIRPAEVGRLVGEESCDPSLFPANGPGGGRRPRELADDALDPAVSVDDTIINAAP